MTDPEAVRVWLVERTFSDDEQNIVILVYATRDGERYLRKERAITSFAATPRETKASLEVAPSTLAPVEDPQTVERYTEAAAQMAREHDPEDAV